MLDKALLKFFADVLYIKEKLCIDEYEDIMEVQKIDDLDRIVDKMLRSEYNQYLRKGESYGFYGYAK